MSITFYGCALLGGLLYYYFVLRRYNSLGFRLFSLFAFAAIMFGYWLYQDSLLQNSFRENGRLVSGLILSKNKISSATTSSPDNAVTVAAVLHTHKTDTVQTSEYISIEEWAAFKPGDQVDLLYDPATDTLVVKISYERMLSEQWIMYVVAGVFLGIGVLCWYFLRHYKIGVDEQTGDEWVEKDGKIYLDERKSPTAKVLKRANIGSKLAQLFSQMK